MSATTLQVKHEVVVVSFADAKIMDSQRIDEIGRELQMALPQAIHKKLVLNFHGVHFMSSAMITKLVTLHRACKAQGIQLRFCEISQNVIEVFKITKLNKLFTIYDSESQAIQSFDKKGWFSS